MCAQKTARTGHAAGDSHALIDVMYDRTIAEAKALLATSSSTATAMNSSAPQVEMAVLDRFSYGMQLGRISDALADLISDAKIDVEKSPALKQFLKMHAAIDVLKDNVGQAPRWPQALSTRVFGDAGLPDLEIHTVPNYPEDDGWKEAPFIGSAGPSAQKSTVAVREPGFATAGEKLAELQTAMRADASLTVSSIRSGPDAAFGMLLQCVTQTGLPSASRPSEVQPVVNFARAVYSDYQIPVINSPLSGTTLAELANTASASASFVFSLASSASAEKYMIGVAVLGGCRIVISASQGIADGLKQSLEYWIKRALKVPQESKELRGLAKPGPKARATAIGTKKK